MVTLVLIAAVAKNGVIGDTVDGKGVLPWRLPDDLKRFKALTLGHPVIMGRKTWESLGRPLPGRRNVVITRNPDYQADGAVVVTSVDSALAACRDLDIAFLIGGAEIYAQALAHADRMELTEVLADYPGDARFPEFDRRQWREASRSRQRCESGPDAGLNYDFVTYLRA